MDEQYQEERRNLAAAAALLTDAQIGRVVRAWLRAAPLWWRLDLAALCGELRAARRGGDDA